MNLHFKSSYMRFVKYLSIFISLVTAIFIAGVFILCNNAALYLLESEQQIHSSRLQLHFVHPYIAKNDTHFIIFKVKVYAEVNFNQ